MQVVHQERRGEHALGLVHPARANEPPHPRVDHGETRLPFLPPTQILRRRRVPFRPPPIPPRLVMRPPRRDRELREDPELPVRELAPVQPVPERAAEPAPLDAVHSCAETRVAQLRIHPTRAELTEPKVRRKQRGGRFVGEIAPAVRGLVRSQTHPLELRPRLGRARLGHVPLGSQAGGPVASRVGWRNQTQRRQGGHPTHVARTIMGYGRGGRRGGWGAGLAPELFRGVHEGHERPEEVPLPFHVDANLIAIEE